MIIFFEGLSGAGKTILIKEFKTKNVIKIPEFINEPNELFDDYACMKNDIVKSELAKQNRNEIVLVDRGYLSTLVYGLVRYKVTNGRERFDHIVYWLLKNLNSKLIRPDIYIWVDASNQVCLNRANLNKRVLPQNFWYKDLDEARLCYKRLFNTIEKDIPLYNINGEDNLKININKLKNIINENLIN